MSEKREVLIANGTLRVSVDVARRIGETLRRSDRQITADSTFTFYREDATILRRYVGTRVVVDRDLPDGTAIWPYQTDAEPFCP